MKRSLGRLLLLALSAAVVYLLVWPVPIDPAAWTPPAAPALKTNRALAAVTRVPVTHGVGPETVAVDAAGRVYAGLTNGRIVRLPPGGPAEVFADTRGRPLGMVFDGAGNLVVADAHRGLLSVSPAGEVRFTDTSSRFRPIGPLRVR